MDAINDRLNAVEYLHTNVDFCRQVGDVLRTLPDLPRLTSRATASRLPLLSFLRLLDGFAALAEMYATLYSESLEPPAAVCLRRVTVLGEGLPDLESLLAKFQFDRHQAREDGGITPVPGEVPEYDAAELKVRIPVGLCECATTD